MKMLICCQLMSLPLGLTSYITQVSYIECLPSLFIVRIKMRILDFLSEMVYNHASMAKATQEAFEEFHNAFKLAREWNSAPARKTAGKLEKQLRRAVKKVFNSDAQLLGTITDETKKLLNSQDGFITKMSALYPNYAEVPNEYDDYGERLKKNISGEFQDLININNFISPDAPIATKLPFIQNHWAKKTALSLADNVFNQSFNKLNGGNEGEVGYFSDISTIWFSKYNVDLYWMANSNGETKKRIEFVPGLGRRRMILWARVRSGAPSE